MKFLTWVKGLSFVGKIKSIFGIFSGISSGIVPVAIGFILAAAGGIWYYVSGLKSDVAEKERRYVDLARQYEDLNATWAKSIDTNREQNRTIAQLKHDHAAAERALTDHYVDELKTARTANKILKRSLDAKNTEKDGPAAAVTLDTMYDIDRMLREK